MVPVRVKLHVYVFNDWGWSGDQVKTRSEGDQTCSSQRDDIKHWFHFITSFSDTANQLLL